MVGRTTVSQAWSAAASNLFWLSGWIMLLIIPALWFADRAQPNGAIVAAE